MDQSALRQAAKLLAESEYTVALSGAGLSVDSGIPDFRSKGGLWERFDPMIYAHIASFKQDPEKVWVMLREMSDLINRSIPNAGHTALAELEKLGKLQGVITQNIDNLHQEAGNKYVVEFHGNTQRLHCVWCGKRYGKSEIATGVFGDPPICGCGKVLKPDVVFFGEAIPPNAYQKSVHMAEKAQVMLVVGTSAQVAPANMLPSITTSTGGVLIEVNLERTHLTDRYDSVLLQGSTTTALPELVDAVKSLLT